MGWRRTPDNHPKCRCLKITYIIWFSPFLYTQPNLDFFFLSEKNNDLIHFQLSKNYLENEKLERRPSPQNVSKISGSSSTENFPPVTPRFFPLHWWWNQRWLFGPLHTQCWIYFKTDLALSWLSIVISIKKRGCHTAFTDDSWADDSPSFKLHIYDHFLI